MIVLALSWLERQIKMIGKSRLEIGGNGCLGLILQSISMASNGSNVVQISHSAIQSPAFRPQQQPQSIHPCHQDSQSPHEFLFQGDETSFSQSVHKLTEENINELTQCHICIIGEEVKPQNIKCFIITLLIGICLIFPLFFFCCQWWKRAVSQIFQIKQETYKDLNLLLSGKKLENVWIKVYDNFLTLKKMKILSRSLYKKSKKINLTFINEAGAFDMNDNEYTGFLKNAKLLLKLSLKAWHIAWYNQYLERQQNPQ